MHDLSGAGSKRQSPMVLSTKRGYSRVEAAAYVGISPTKFDELVQDGRLPQAKQIDGRKVWDIRELDPAFDELGNVDTSWDGLSENSKIP